MSGRLQVPVSVTYDGDPRRVEAILLEIAEAHPLVVEDPEPLVLFLDLGADTMNFELRCWLRDVNFMLSVRSDMNFEIAERFAKEGIRTRFYGREVPPDRAAQRPDPNTQPDLQAPEQEAAT
jgi:small-conductance mechanosensitive channel